MHPSFCARNDEVVWRRRIYLKSITRRKKILRFDAASPHRTQNDREVYVAANRLAQNDREAYEVPTRFALTWPLTSSALSFFSTSVLYSTIRLFFDQTTFYTVKELLYVIPPADHNTDSLVKTLAAHPEICFVSLAAVDLSGNDTDEKIPVSHFIENIEEFLTGGVQTDGSSVVLPGIATLNDGKVDLIADPSVNWFVDYNREFLHPQTQLPVGTLRIPSFLKHGGRLVGSRALLKRAVESGEQRILKMLKMHPAFLNEMKIDSAELESVKLFAATELEFWVRTPGAHIETEKLTISQQLHESYWKRTKGAVRSALEESLMILEKLALIPEMGHKEVGGVKATMEEHGRLNDIMEQLEIDWRYSTAQQAADNELIARITIKETFRRYGLEATFMAKPLEGVAGSGEHTHISIVLQFSDGSTRNLFAPADPNTDFLSIAGWGALMGLLRNYEAVAPFITGSNDAFNRLKPGFEAPICIVASVGHDISMPSRNRTVLVGLIRDCDNPKATRFELRSPNPHTNTFLALTAVYQAMLDGMEYAAASGKTAGELQRDFFKAPGVTHDYLEKERAYHSEEDVFCHFTEEERNKRFGIPPATVWETLENLRKHPEKTAVLGVDGVLSPDIVAAYRQAMISQWFMELCDRIVPENIKQVRNCIRQHKENGNRLDHLRWEEIQLLRERLVCDDLDRPSIATSVRKAAAAADYATASRLQLELLSQMERLAVLYRRYSNNIL